MRKVHTKCYQKQVTGHHIQMDVKFPTFKGEKGEKMRRFQYTAIDDVTRVRVLKIYEKQTHGRSYVLCRLSLHEADRSSHSHKPASERPLPL